MARLPVIGADAGNWGTLLNEFLLVAHHEDGSLRHSCHNCEILNVRDFGAKGDGATNPLADDTAALQAAFAAVPPEGAVVCVPPGVYMVNKILALKSKTHLKGAGAGSLFKRMATGTGVIFFSEGVSDVTVEAIAVDLNGAGQGATTNFATGIAFRTGSSHLRIRDCRVFDSTGTTVMGRMGILVLESDHVWIERNHLRDGLRLKAGGVGDRLIIENNLIEDPDDNGITVATFDANSQTVNYVIRGNIIKAAQGAFIYVGDDGLSPENHPLRESGILYQNILIDGNLLLGPVQVGQVMIVVNMANVTERLHIVNNILSNVEAIPGAIAGIETAIQTPFGRRGTDFLIANNTVEGNFTEQAGIWVRSADRVRVVHNQVSNGSAYGIRIGTVFDPDLQQQGGVDTAIVQGNIISNYTRGLWVEDSTHIQVIGNSFRGLTLEGILLQTSAADQQVSAYLLGNQVVDNGGVGIKETGAGAFDTHYLFNDLRNNSGGAFAGINGNATRVGNLGAADAIQRHITGSALWDPPLVAHGATQSTTVPLTGAQVGASVAVGFTQPLPAGALFAGSVTAADQVTVTLVNLTGSAFDLAQGTVSVQVW